MARKVLIQLPGLIVREPLRPRPIAGALIGGATGLLFGAMAVVADAFQAPDRSVVTGYVYGGLAAGAIVGVLAPAFRHRGRAGLVISLAIAAGLAVAVPRWGEDWGAPLIALNGALSGLAYATLFWDYRPSAGEAAPGSPAASE